MLRLLLGTALLPTAAVSLYVAARTLFDLAANARTAAPFVAGALACGLARVFFDFRRSCLGAGMRRVYVFGHELTHALAAWGLGGKVYGMEVGPDGGHVDLSHSNAFIALAPYCVPIYTVVVILAYRLLLWRDPAIERQEIYMFLLGSTFCFHLVFTFDSLWGNKQPDIEAGGGAVFSLALIALANGLTALLLLKALFPRSVYLMESFQRMAQLTVSFWRIPVQYAGSLADQAMKK